jgi:hypothetical protein
MKDARDIVLWLEEEIAYYEMRKEEMKSLSNKDEARYMMSQELLAWILNYKFDPKYSVSRVPSEVEQDTKAFGSRI